MTGLNACRLIHLLNFKCFNSTNLGADYSKKSSFQLRVNFIFFPFTELPNSSFIYGIKTTFYPRASRTDILKFVCQSPCPLWKLELEEMNFWFMFFKIIILLPLKNICIDKVFLAAFLYLSLLSPNMLESKPNVEASASGVLKHLNMEQIQNIIIKIHMWFYDPVQCRIDKTDTQYMIKLLSLLTAVF